MTEENDAGSSPETNAVVMVPHYPRKMTFPADRKGYGGGIVQLTAKKLGPFAVWCGWVCQVVTVLRSSLPQVR